MIKKNSRVLFQLSAPRRELPPSTCKSATDQIPLQISTISRKQYAQEHINLVESGRADFHITQILPTEDESRSSATAPMMMAMMTRRDATEPAGNSSFRFRFVSVHF